MLFPYDALNARTDISGNASSTLFTIPPTETYTILYESFNTSSQTANASLFLSCGDLISLRVNSFASVPSVERFKLAKCTATSTPLNFDAGVHSTTGSPISTISVIYAPYDTALMAPELVASTTFGAALPATVANISYTVDLLILVAALLVIDLLRRLVFPSRT